MPELYREGEGDAKAIKCIVLRNRAKNRGGSKPPRVRSKLLRTNKIYFFAGFFLVP
jgi:hypothetical protein